MIKHTDKTCGLCARMGKWCSVPAYLLYRLTHLRFLPEQWRRWLFGTGTRALKLMNAAILIGWAVVVSEGGFGRLPSYAGFSRLPKTVAVPLMAGTALLLLITMHVHTVRGRFFAALGLNAASLIYLGISISFWVAYPPLNTGMVIYPILTVISWLAGEHLRDQAHADDRAAAVGEEEGA